tara:strand:+ start:595 stop:1341 length:747 start_codon:yes stop_codon:yes gene_type:complete
MGLYTYTSSNGKIKVKNATGYFDKKREQVIMSCEAKFSSLTDSSCFSGIWVGANRETFGDVVLGNGKWHNVKIAHNISTDGEGTPSWALKSHGEQTFSIVIADTIVYSEGEYVKVDIAMDIDLDPVEYHLTFLNDDFGSDSTPDIQWSLSDLGQEAFMNKPTLTVVSTGDYVIGLTVTFVNEDGSGSTDVVIGTGGIVNMNGVTIGSSSVPFSNTKTYFRKIKAYKLTSPTMVEGLNDFTIDLKCEVI